ncbi:nuclear transport factor 2 family protein [uncultured Psychroserpens sp.]|uniref:nuclear transport factor 2 family protein n=1 Tax=uncultured Psychroserpens sp. TaxID=255436 RepID=UPI0026339192|nr:nuclear transport factor 2 family protein [uncultured Psychroserpens sp.]
MKYYIFLFFFTIPLLYFSQSNIEVLAFDLDITNGSYELSNFKNLSNNEGYDNQPSFLDDRYILFASTRNGQTDIAKYHLDYDSKTWLNFSEGGEYTPIKIPNKDAVSAVRLDKDGKQRLYAYSLRNGESSELIQDLVVAYYTWFDEYIIVSAVIEGESLNLFVTNLQDGRSRKFKNNVGRSFHRIPNSNLISYISKEDPNQWQIKSLNPTTGETKVIANTIEGIEDICWLNSKTILSGKDHQLYKLTLQKDNNWKQIADLSKNGITKITRLVANNKANKLLIAGELGSSTTTETNAEGTKTEKSESETTTSTNTAETTSVEAIVQKQLNAYNARNIDAFMATYATDVKLYNYPNQLRTDGYEQMRKSYSEWFKNAPDLNAYIKKRIVIGNKVIDEEQVTANGQIFHAVAIYEVENGKIKKVTFIQ